jgi:hypothetical protein
MSPSDNLGGIPLSLHATERKAHPKLYGTPYLFGVSVPASKAKMVTFAGLWDLNVPDRAGAATSGTLRDGVSTKEGFPAWRSIQYSMQRSLPSSETRRIDEHTTQTRHDAGTCMLVLPLLSSKLGQVVNKLKPRRFLW